jgi:hypothetical protein
LATDVLQIAQLHDELLFDFLQRVTGERGPSAVNPIPRFLLGLRGLDLYAFNKNHPQTVMLIVLNS